MTRRVRELLREAASTHSGVTRRDAEVLLGHCLRCDRSWLYAHPEAEPQQPERACFDSLLRQRARGVPVAYLTGEREFWSLTLEVDRHTLIPRPETELLVEWSLEFGGAAARVLDLGTGSGAIAVALAAQCPAWDVVALDSSEQALAVARRNAQRHCPGRIQFLCSEWFAALEARPDFDLVVSNPPYVEPDSPYLARGDVRFEPANALVAAENGLSCLRHIIEITPRYLRQGGGLLLEHGAGQGRAVRAMLQQRGFTKVAGRTDLAGLERVSAGFWGG